MPFPTFPDTTLDTTTIPSTPYTDLADTGPRLWADMSTTMTTTMTATTHTAATTPTTAATTPTTAWCERAPRVNK